MVIAKFLDMDIADIIVTKGKLKDIQACESVIYAEDDEEIGGIDLDGIVEATNIINPIVDEYDICDDSYILDVISKERGN